MGYYNANQRPMNRAERRKNGIKTQKTTKNNITREQFDKIEGVLKKELTALMTESYSDSLKRERYNRLKPLIKEYEEQKDKFKPKQDIKKQENKTEAVIAYNKEKEKLQTNPIYQKLNSNGSKIYSQPKQATMNYKTQKVISGYETQMNYSRITETVSRAHEEAQSNVKKATPSKKKKGFFAQLIDMFRKQPKKINVQQQMAKSNLARTVSNKSNLEPKKKVEERKTISRPGIITTAQRYTYKRTAQFVDDVYNKFERSLRDFSLYSKENPNYKTYINGREVRFRERYL